MISIIIPTYNRKPLLERAVHSALDQTEADTEILLRSIAENYADSPVDEDFLKKYK